MSDTQHWNPEHLPETLAALGAWWAEELLSSGQDSPAGAALEAACNRLFAAPEPAPRSEAEQAVLALVRDWLGGVRERRWQPTQPETLALYRAADAAWVARPTCENPGCTKSGTEPTEGRDGSTLHLCVAHAAWFVAAAP